MIFYDSISSGASLSAKGQLGLRSFSLLKPFFVCKHTRACTKGGLQTKKSGSKSHATRLPMFAGRPAAAKGSALRSEPSARAVANSSLRLPSKGLPANPLRRERDGLRPSRYRQSSPTPPLIRRGLLPDATRRRPATT